ncbi:guanylate kinase [Desulfonatronovibrio magnus]|uniref:guanylate kinase n=1 Tax=Desulfonatronovibrio magnus TaxID=698827 RepID=UPI0005EAE1CB|nr:guanylate kinase [Desulfonatronovibrio magnus]RQD62539.1 MAG: guanylate kinase [Desulfonatronovibrio sp. MSAO_Bac4]
MNKGILLIISAPSGTGKSTLINMLIKDYPDIGFSISYTTRKPRQGEVHGQNYYFVTRDEFLNLREENFFAEWAEVHGNFYGTPAKEVTRAIDRGKSLIFDIDVQGAAQIRKNLQKGVLIFIFPPSLKTLEQRLSRRATDSSDIIARRLKNAQDEILQSTMFDYWIINDDLHQAYEDLKSIARAEKLRPSCLPSLPERVVKYDSIHTG